MAKEAKEFFLKKEILHHGESGEVLGVRFMLGNGLEIRSMIKEMSKEIKLQLIAHGISQKVGDAASGYAKARDFHGAFGALQSVADNLVNGVWSSRAGGGNTDLAQAIAELQGVSVDEVTTALEKMDEEQFAQVKKHPKVKAKVAEMQAARAKLAAEKGEAEDIGEMLNGLLGR